jgi:hypothetical protein
MRKLGDRPMTNAERQRLWRKRHALPVPEWCRDLLVLEAPAWETEFSYEQDPVMRALLMEEVAESEAEVEEVGPD